MAKIKKQQYALRRKDGQYFAGFGMVGEALFTDEAMPVARKVAEELSKYEEFKGLKLVRTSRRLNREEKALRNLFAGTNVRKYLDASKSMTATGKCSHGKVVETKIALPLRAVILEVPDEGGSPYVVWLQAKPTRKTPIHYVIPVTPLLGNAEQACLLANGLNEYLKTTDGQTEGRAYARQILEGWPIEPPSCLDSQRPDEY